MMLWNTFILASALAEIVGCTPLPSIIERAAFEYYNEAEEVDGCGIATFGAYY